MSTNNDVWITLIICISILLLAALVFCYFYGIASKKMNSEDIDENKRFLDFCYKVASSTNKEDEVYKKACWKYLAEKYGLTIEENTASPKEDKEAVLLAKNKQRFIDFCFEMAKTSDSGDSEEYWKIIKRKFDEPTNSTKNQ